MQALLPDKVSNGLSTSRLTEWLTSLMLQILEQQAIMMLTLSTTIIDWSEPMIMSLSYGTAPEDIFVMRKIKILHVYAYIYILVQLLNIKSILKMFFTSKAHKI